MPEELEQDREDVHVNEVRVGDGGSGLREGVLQHLIVLHDSIVVRGQASELVYVRAVVR